MESATGEAGVSSMACPGSFPLDEMEAQANEEFRAEWKEKRVFRWALPSDGGDFEALVPTSGRPWAGFFPFSRGKG